MRGKERLRFGAVLCVWTLGCYTGFDELETSCEAPLSSGDVRITEILANPKGPDGQQEYIELFNATAAELDLSGAVLLTSHQDGSAERGHTIRTLRIPPGEYVVVGSADPDPLGHLDYSYGSALGNLRNSEARVALLCGATLVDEVGYASTTEGYALELDGSMAHPPAGEGDPAAHWCNSSEAGDEPLPGNFGTPGAPNRICPIRLQPGSCLDEGRPRAIVAPGVGELRISEWMANPERVSDSQGEWFEVTAMANVDLNGLRLSDSSGSETRVEQDECLTLKAGTTFVFSRGPDGTSNGGLPDTTLTFAFSLNNTQESVRLSVGDEPIDEVAYEKSTPGASTQIDIHGKICTSWAVYGEGDFGSPGELNPECP
jgi:hypothetical protein